MTSILMVPVAWFAAVSLETPTANNSDDAFFRLRSRQNRRATWENSIGKPFILAITLFPTEFVPKPTTRERLGKFPAETVYLGDHALMGSRSRQNRRPAWENSQRKPPSMAITLFLTTIMPKRATEFGENRSGARLLWRSRNKPIGLAKPFGLEKQRGLVKQSEITPVVGARMTRGPYFWFRRSKESKK